MYTHFRHDHRSNASLESLVGPPWVLCYRGGTGFRVPWDAEFAETLPGSSLNGSGGGFRPPFEGTISKTTIHEMTDMIV